MKKILITIFLITFLLPFSFSNAQIQSSIDGVNIKSDPRIPAPLELVTVAIESYLIDLNSASVVWFADGKTIKSGVGMKEISIKAPVVGKKITVSVIIKTSNGREIRKAVILKSGSVDIIWQTEGYAPPFYKGRNSFVYQNKIKLIAMPHLSVDGIKEVDPSNVVYQWKRDGKYIDDATGFGKQSVTINAGSIPKPLEISLDVYTRDQTQSATRKISIEPMDPSLSFYEISPLYGTLFNKAIPNNLTLNNSEITVLAVPFGFNYKNNPLTYNWSINNFEQPSLIKNQSITLRPKGDMSGSSNIDVDIRNARDILQGVRDSFNVNFKKKEDLNNQSPF